MSMLSITRLCGFLLVAIGLVGYVGTGATSITALIPAFVGALLLILALIGRQEAARKHAMHVAVALALISALATLPRLIPPLMAAEFTRPSVVAQLAMVLVLAFYVAMGVKSFVDARRAR